MSFGDRSVPLTWRFNEAYEVLQLQRKVWTWHFSLSKSEHILCAFKIQKYLQIYLKSSCNLSYNKNYSVPRSLNKVYSLSNISQASSSG